MKRRILATAVAVLLLSGCATPGTPVAEPTATASATPTATPTPTPDPADPANWVIGFGTFGPLALGQPLTPALPALSAFNPEIQEACPWLVVAGPPATWILTDGSDLVTLVAFGDGRVPPEGSFQWATSEGIAVGSTQAEVVGAYPSVVATEGRYETAVYSVTDGTSFINIVVQNASGIVTTIEVSSTSEVYPEYCG